jgi:homogentisate 1,2-dioxygenase
MPFYHKLGKIPHKRHTQFRKENGDLGSRLPEIVDFGPIRHRAFKTLDAPLGGDPVSSRIPLLANKDVILGVARAGKSMDYFYRNAQAYETWWVHEGSGILKSQFGNLKFHSGDYIVIPFGTTWQMRSAFLHDRESIPDRTSKTLSQ